MSIIPQHTLIKIYNLNLAFENSSKFVPAFISNLSFVYNQETKNISQQFNRLVVLGPFSGVYVSCVHVERRGQKCSRMDKSIEFEVIQTLFKSNPISYITTWLSFLTLLNLSCCICKINRLLWGLNRSLDIVNSI